jgi:hypothetical protein
MSEHVYEISADKTPIYCHILIKINDKGYSLHYELVYGSHVP